MAAVIEGRHAKERDASNKNRLLAIKLAARGEYTSAEIADFCGIARGHLFRWIKTVREEGLEGLLKRGKPGPKEGACRGLSPSVAAELAAKLAAGEFVSAVAATRWLKEAHGLERPYQSVWRWLKKAGGVLLVPPTLLGRARARAAPGGSRLVARSSKLYALKSSVTFI